jgi:polyhydroxyalkanoate synthesis regulator phasin
MTKSTIKSYVEAGTQFTEMSRQQAEAFVKNLVAAGDIRRRDAEQMLQTMLSRGRETTSQLTALVQSEVAKQLSALSERFEDVESRLESLAASLRDGLMGDGGGGPTGRSPAPEPSSATSAPPHTTAQKSGAKKSGAKKSATKAGAKKSASKKSATKKSAAKKSSAKKSSAKKPAVKKTSAKRSAAKKTSAEKSTAVGSSGVRKVSTSRSASSE